MRILKAFGLLLLVMLMGPIPRVSAESTGYIAGEVRFPEFTTTSVSMTAVGGGNTFQKTTYDSSSYQMPVAGGGWNYLVSASAGLSGGNNNSLTVSFSQRSFPVAAETTVTNSYLFNPGIVRFQVDITGDQPTSSSSTGSWATKAVATGEKTATYSSGTPSTGRRYTRILANGNGSPGFLRGWKAICWAPWQMPSIGTSVFRQASIQRYSSSRKGWIAASKTLYLPP